MYEFVRGMPRRERLQQGLHAKSGCDAEGYAGCARRVTINQKPKPDPTNLAAG